MTNSTIARRSHGEEARPTQTSNISPPDSGALGPVPSFGETEPSPLATPNSSRQAAGLLTIREVASLLRVSESTVRNAIRKGQLRAFRFGARRGTIRIGKADFEDYLASCVTEPTPTVKRRSRTAGSPFTALDGGRLLAAWRRQGVLADRPNEGSAPSSESRCGP